MQGHRKTSSVNLRDHPRRSDSRFSRRAPDGRGAEGNALSERPNSTVRTARYPVRPCPLVGPRSRNSIPGMRHLPVETAARIAALADARFAGPDPDAIGLNRRDGGYFCRLMMSSAIV